MSKEVHTDIKRQKKRGGWGCGTIHSYEMNAVLLEKFGFVSPPG